MKSIVFATLGAFFTAVACGCVTKGMDVVKKIQASTAKGQTLEPAITIKTVTRVP
jgi:hypothetical protein